MPEVSVPVGVGYWLLGGLGLGAVWASTPAGQDAIKKTGQALSNIHSKSDEDTQASSTVCKDCTKAQKCRACQPVPVGGKGYMYHSAAMGNDPHFDKATGVDMPDHTHHYLMQQSPPSAGCKCFWKRDFINPTPGFSPLPGAVQVIDAYGGGIDQ